MGWGYPYQDAGHWMGWWMPFHGVLSLIILVMGVFPEPVIRHVEQATAGFWSVSLK